MEVKSKNPFTSVVIAAFNEEKYLSRCLESLRNQTYPKDRFRIIVVDNNSTDKTAQIAREFGAQVIPEKRQGNTFALKRGLDEAEGDIIAVTDSDTKVANDWLWTIARTFADPEVVAATGLIHVNAGSKIVSRLMEAAYFVYMYADALAGKFLLSGFNFAVRREAYLKVGGMDPAFVMSSDLDLGIRLAKIGKAKIVNNMMVDMSIRRWEQQGFFSTLFEYTKSIFYAVWLRKPPPVKQAVIR